MEDQRFLDLYVFGDQTYDIQVRDLRRLIYDEKSNPIVVEFLERARQALQNDLWQLSSEDRRQAPSFACTLDFMLWRKGHCMPVDMAILCLYQLGTFMRQVGHSYPSPSSSCCLGLCTGALAAAAVSCSSSTLELLPLAIDAVRFAFRIGMLVDKMTRCIEPWDIDTKYNGKTRDTSGPVSGERLPWAFLMKGSDIDVCVSEFNEENNLPLTARLWISAISTGDTVAVSGRPTSLAHFLAWRQSSKPEQRNAKPLQIFAPYHAPHLYSRDDIEQALPLSNISGGQCDTSVASASRLCIPLISSTTGNIAQETDRHTGFRTLLGLAAEQILLQSIRWEPILAELHNRLQTIDDNIALRVFPVATTADRLIYNGLQQHNPSIPFSGKTSQHKTSPRTRSSTSTSTSASNGEKVAIIGMAGRFPEAATTDALWDILRLGIDVCKEVPPLRWDAKTHLDPSGRRNNTSRTSLGCWLNDPDVFDPQFFGISDQEATRMDPAQRLALMTTYEAIEQAGIVWPSGVDGASDVRSARPDRVGVYCGVAGNDWRDCNAAQKIDSHFMRASNRAYISGRISEIFKLGGPSLTVDTSSSGSLAPVQLACRSLSARETDTCVVTGAQIMTNPDVHAGFDQAGLLSHSGSFKAIAEKADGFCRGEGVVTLVLKRLAEAEADNDTILGVIAGVSTAYNPHQSAGGSEVAHTSTENTALTECLNRSNVDPASITYVEMGGPHTNFEDILQVANSLGASTPKPESVFAAKGRNTPLCGGSAAANIGHGEATSGLSGIIKILLMLREKIIPPIIGKAVGGDSKTLDGLLSPGKAIEWVNAADLSPQSQRRCALILDQGTIAPANWALLLEENPLQNQRRHGSSAVEDNEMEGEQCSRYIIAVSAKSKPSLHRNMTNLHTWLKSEAMRDQFTLPQVSYTTTARRNHYANRAAFVVSSIEEACTQVCAALQESRVQLKSTPTGASPTVAAGEANRARPIVFTFDNCNYPSSASVEYFRQLYKSFSHVRRDIKHFDQITRLLDLPSVINSLGLKGGGERELHQHSQGPQPHTTGAIAYVCVQIVIFRLWQYWGINPVALVTEGDLDMYSALNIAGVLSDADAVYLAGAHLHLGLLQKDAHRSTEYEADWHTLMAAKLERLDRVTKYHKAKIPVLRLITAKSGDVRSANPRLDVAIDRGENDRAFLSRRLLTDFRPAKFESESQSVSNTRDLFAALRASSFVPKQSIIHFAGPAAPVFLDATPECISGGSSVGGDFHSCSAAKEASTIQTQGREQMWSHLTGTLRMFYHERVNIRWDQYHIDLPSSSRSVVSTLPTYSWDLKEYWVPYSNDWTLLKGGPSKSAVVPKLESTTIHTIVEEIEILQAGANKLRLVVEADISRHDLHGTVQGHVVDGVPLCTPSVYSDIALSLAKYIQQRYLHGSRKRLINIKDMAVTKALIAQPTGPQVLRAYVDADWESNSATCKFNTLDRHSKIQEHAQCTILFTDAEIMEHIEQFDMAGSYCKLVQALRQGISTHRTVRFTRNMMYRMISSLAEFHPDHKLVEDIVLDSKTHEATAMVSFRQLLDDDGKQSGTFHTHPGVVDALTQPAGFALNGADTTDLDNEVYINHGWGAFYQFETMELTKSYTVYVHMTEGESHIWYGDIVVLDMGNDESAPRVVALFEKYSVQRMPRRVLSILLRAEGGGAYKNAKSQSQSTTQSWPDHRKDELPKSTPQTISPSSTLVSPVQMFERQLEPPPTSISTSRVRDKGQPNLHIKVGTAAPAAGPPTPLTAKALSLNNNMLSSPGPRCEILERSVKIISEETGYELADIDNDNLVLADIGIDSLLSLAIISRFREELGNYLSHLDLNTVFMACPTIASLKATLAGNKPTQDPRNVREWRTTSTNTAPITLSPPGSILTQELSQGSEITMRDFQVPQATSVILQGTPKKARATLFLFPDGSGSATSYASIPPISSIGELCVIAFNCPFLKKESSMLSCSLDALIDQGYLPELQRRLELRSTVDFNTEHNYYVGGWSAGGTLAYRAAQRLLQQEDEVMHSPKGGGKLVGLVLIDAPPPIRGMDPLPDHFYRYCEQKGVFGGWSGTQARKTPDWLIPHFNGTIAILQHYVADPLTRAQSARLRAVACLWAGESVVGSDRPLEPHTDDTEGMKFLTVQRTDYSTAGWEKLVPGVDASAILCGRMEGAHHFSLTASRSPYVSKLAAFIRQAMALD